MSDLKACPFCGGEAITNEDLEEMEFQTACDDVRCRVAPATHCLSTKADAIKTWNTRADQWISVEDRLPEERVSVFATNGDWRERMSYEPSAALVGKWFRGTEVWMRGYPTHWMPMPQLPKEAA